MAQLGRLAFGSGVIGCDFQRTREAALGTQLELQSPRYWLEAYEAAVQRREFEPALSTLSKGFLAVHEDMRNATYKLALHYYSLATETSTDSLRKAWYFSSIASAIRDDEDVRFVRDGLREIDAEISRKTGSYNPRDPQWNEFESVPGFTKTRGEIRGLLNKMGARASELAKRGQAAEAQRMQARITYIASLYFDPTEPDMLVVRGNAAKISAIVGDWEAVLADTEFVVAEMTKTRGAEHRETLVMRHLLVPALKRCGRMGEAIAEGKALLPAVEREFGEHSVLALAVKSAMESGPGNASSRLIIGSSHGYYDLNSGSRVGPPRGFPPFGTKATKQE